MEIIRASDQEVIQVSDILTYRCSTLSDPEIKKEVTWHKWGDANCVANHFGLKYEELNAARSTEEYVDFATKWAAENNVDFKHVKPAKNQPRNGGITKADYEGIGRGVVADLEARAIPHEENTDEEHATNLEWVEEQLPQLIAQSAYTPNTRPAKPKKTATQQDKIDKAVDEKLNEAKQAATEKGLSEEDIAAIFGS